MKYLEIRRRLTDSGLFCFTPAEFKRLLGGSKIGVRKLLERYTKRGVFARLKNGLYVVSEKKPPLFAIANKIYKPSYVSLETALSYYGIIPETIYSIASVSPKITREFFVDDKSFLFRKIKKEAFSGYRPIKIERETVLIAEPEKALADYLYFAYLKKKDMVERIRWNRIKKGKLSRYIKMFNNTAFTRWVKNVV